jgi:cell division protein FtsB
MPVIAAQQKTGVSVKLLLASGIVLTVLLVYTLAVGKGGLLDIWNMKRDISAQQEQNERLKQRNRELAGEIINLQKGTEAIEERARSDLGLIRPDEVFVQIIE